ncbi:MAG: V-type ATPase 116kDa subunit family protein [Desulfurococcaceae archaeon]
MILLSKPTPMKKIIVASPIEYKEETIALLQEAGVVDIAQHEPSKITSEYEALVKLREEISDLLSKVKNIHVKAELTALELSSLTVDKVKADINAIRLRVNKMDSELNSLRKIEEEARYFINVISKFPDDVNPKEFFYVGKRVSSLLVTCRRENVDTIITHPAVKSYSIYNVSEEITAMILYVESENVNRFLEVLKTTGAWYPSGKILEYIEKASSLVELKEILQKELGDIHSKVAVLEKELENYIKDHLQLLGKYLLYVENTLRRYIAISTTQDLKHVIVLTGWIPLHHSKELSSFLAKADIPLYFEIRDPEPNDTPPTLMENKPVLRFFQVITRLYGIPGYHEWDPTPIIAYSFALFFGLMNADAGYALVGVLATLLILDRLVVDTESQPYKEFKGTLLVSNMIALILGFLSGTVFGDFLQRLGINLPVVLTAVITPLDFIKLSLVIGLIHVNIAHVLATVKFIKERKLGELLIEIGLFISQLFGIPYLLKMFFKYNVPLLSNIQMDILLYLSFAGVFLIIIGSFLTMRALGFLMWIFQITGVLGDVLSYVRLAGVGLATYYMASIFNFMLSMLMNYFASFHLLIGIALTIPLLFLAHLVVFMLAELGAFIHSLRLCMLEFLTKFYEGNGYEYNPFRIVGKLTITTGS